MYRILTEDVNRNQTLDLVAAVFDGFTVIPATGFWKGQEEASLIIEIETTDRILVFAVADAIKEHNKQESVMVQLITTTDTWWR